MPAQPHRRLRTFGKVAFGAALVFCALVAFGISGDDEAAFRSFTEAARRWQVNPEFRSVAMDYSIRGSRAMRTHPMLISSSRMIMALRSVPSLPPRYAINPTSRLHYENFTRGPLSAYLHLSGEQSMPDYLGIFESAG